MAKSGPICQRKAACCLKVPLKSTEQIYLVFLIPILINCIIYIVHFSADLVVAIQHFRDNNPLWGTSTLCFIYAPAVAYFILTISRPDWWMTDNDKVTKGIVFWFLLQICHLVGFPFFALYRYAGLIVMAVDAILLTEEERIKTLNVAAAPAAIELYFFLQAWFQAAPQALFQTHLLFREYPTHRSFQSVIVQVLCIIMSIMVLAIETTSFQRFESQRVNGRKLPWAMWLKKYRIEELHNFEEQTPLQLSNRVKADNMCTEKFANKSNEEGINKKEKYIETKTKDKKSDIPISLDRQISVTPPLPPKNVHITPPPTPLRGITTVTSLPVPDVPAPPRPDSIIRSLEQDEQEEQSQNLRSMAIVDSKQNSTHSLKVPKRKYSMKGLEEDDPVGKFLSFLWWFFFIFARILTITTFYEFYSYYLAIVLGLHYGIMLAYLFYYAKYYDAVMFFINLWLGLVYIFSAIEYRIKFKYADRWLFSYYTFVMLQNTLMTLSSYFYADWDGFWYTYIFYAIFASMVLCISSTVVYHILLKPKKRRVYGS